MRKITSFPLAAWPLGIFAALAVAVTACAGSSNAPATGCSGLSACCATLGGDDAEACQAALSMGGVTDAECTAALEGYESSGLCSGGGGGSGGSGGSPKSGGSSDEGGVGVDGGVALIPGCAALAACCPDLPVSEDPMACLTVAMEGTTEACAESLVTYQSAGYCAPAAGTPGSGCYELSGTGTTETCIYATSAAPGFDDCTSVSGLLVGTCPSVGLVGCCISTSTESGYAATTAACYYEDSEEAEVARENCTNTDQSWSLSAP